MLGEQITRFIPHFRQKPVDFQAQARREVILTMANEKGSFTLEDARIRLEEMRMISRVANALVTHDVYTLVSQNRLGIQHIPTPEGKIPQFHPAQTDLVGPAKR